MALVRKKVRSNQTHTILEPEPGEEPPAPRREVVDLMPLLKQSLERRAKGADGKRAPLRRARGRRQTKSA
jgi:DNA end-binding protein Ku